jgi:RND superfamily putative drug exporter
VLILSRINEARAAGRRASDAVAEGIKASAGVVTSAAVIMVFVFLCFVGLSLTSMKQAGLGLAIAVLIDATVIRVLLLPAVMTMLGERNWYLPRALRWLPHVDHGTSVPAAAATHVVPEARAAVDHSEKSLARR